MAGVSSRHPALTSFSWVTCSAAPTPPAVVRRRALTRRAGRTRTALGPTGGAREKARAGERKKPGDEQKPGEKRGGEKRKTEEKRSGRKSGDAGQTRGSARTHASNGSSAAPLFYRGPVPRRRLRLAEFLYYSGRIPWQSLINAIVWQRAMQPKFGELAREMQSISRPDLAKILGSRLRHEQMGETAQRLRLLTAAQVERILRMQRARRSLIGRYFVEKESMAGDVPP